MDELFLKCYRLVLENIRDRVPFEAISLLSISVLALYLVDKEIVLEKMPSIIQNTWIKIERRSIIEQVREVGIKDEACFSRINGAVSTVLCHDEFGNPAAGKILFVRLDYSKKRLEIINTIVHELTHLLREQKPVLDGEIFTLQGGVSMSRYNTRTEVSENEFHWFEDAIVEHHAKKAIDALMSFLENDTDKTNCLMVLDGGKETYKDIENISYSFFNITMDVLNEDDNFKKIIDDSFREQYVGGRLSKYFNEVMAGEVTFSEYASLFDQLGEAMEANNPTPMEGLFKKIGDITRDFYFRTGANEKRGIKRPYEKVE